MKIFLAVVLAAAISACAPAQADVRACVADTSAGTIAGVQTGNICTYKGIPYAAPPTGDRRFKPPQPASRWSGTLKATDGSKVCPQFPDRSSEDYPDNRQTYVDENCLVLNVWAPRNGHGHRPVIVFVHGGAAIFGNANETRYDGTTLAKKGDAVVVTINYRLGVFGWAELGDLDPAYRGSGNNGLRDQIAAFTWVRQHIADFGGDPGNVTAVGESEGAFSLSALLATDHPQRLFRRVVLESGSGYLNRSATLEKQLVTPFLKAAKNITTLKSMSATQLLTLQEKVLESLPGAFTRAVYFGPYVDGTLVKAPVIQRVRAGNARGIDLIVGSNRDELRYFAQFDPSVLKLTQQQYGLLFPKALDNRRQAMVSAYSRPGLSEGDIALAMANDQTMRVPATRLAAAQSRWARSYLYQFDWAPPKGLGAIHTAELPFVFGTLRFTGIPGGVEALAVDRKRMTALSNRMVTAWTSFARNGNPGWPVYGPGRATMIWNLTSKVAYAPNDAERALWDPYDFPALDLNLPGR
jgi:para-nitrobenzyl esterase